MSELQQLEQQLKDAKELVGRRDLALKLSGNRDFKKLILDDFCVTEAARLVALSADPSLDDRQKADALSMAQAAGHLKRFLSMMVVMGNSAERQIDDIDEAIVELRQEEDQANTQSGNTQDITGDTAIRTDGNELVPGFQQRV